MNGIGQRNSEDPCIVLIQIFYREHRGRASYLSWDAVCAFQYNGARYDTNICPPTVGFSNLMNWANLWALGWNKIREMINVPPGAL